LVTLKRDPSNTEALSHRAQEWQGLKEYDQSLTDFKKFRRQHQKIKLSRKNCRKSNKR
jgi:hypothetical protein